MHFSTAPRLRHSTRTFAPDIAFSNTGYLNAQFKFMLKPTGDYTVHFADRACASYVCVYVVSHAAPTDGGGVECTTRDAYRCKTFARRIYS
jgi:hypothetical protein